MTFEPHMHSSGKRMCVEAIYPDGKREMVNCAGYNHNWVKVYTYEDDVAPLLPTGHHSALHRSGTTTAPIRECRAEELERVRQPLD